MTQLLMVDIRTVMLLLCLGNLSAAGLLLISGGRLRDTPDSLFTMTRLLQGLAWPLLALRGDIADPLSFGLGNSLLLAGFWLETVCIRALDQDTRPWPAFWRTCLLAAAFSLSIGYLIPQAHLRVALGSAAAAAGFALSGLQLLRGVPGPSPLRTALGCLYLILCGAVLWRGIVACLTCSVTLLTPGLAPSLSYLPLYLLMISGSFGLLLVFKERTDQTLAHIATFDALTGAPNRRTLLEQARRLAAQAHREATPLAVFMLDIDRFKLVNDTYGHATGDIVLKDLARIIAESLRAYDAFGRFGGEEFVAALPGASMEDARNVAERIRATVELSRPLKNERLRYTVSIGIAWGIPGKEGLTTLLNQADQAMYKAKRMGRNRIATPATDEHEG